MVWLSPHGLVAARRRRSFGPRRTVALHEQQVAPKASLRDWSAVLAALEAHIGAAPCGRVEIAVALSDHFVRYACLPWRAGLRSMQDWEAYAAHELERRYGAKHAEAVRIAPAARGAPRLAAAIDQGLLARLRQLAASTHSRLASVEPNACRVANRFRRALGANGRLVVAEPQRLTWFEALGDRWSDVRSVRQSGAEAWSSLALQARLQTGQAGNGGKLLAWGCDVASGADAFGAALKVLAPPAFTPPACAAMGMI